MTLFPHKGLLVEVEGGAFHADSATVTGDVTFGEQATVWFGSVLRGDDAPIVIGKRTNIQDLTMVHPDPGVPSRIGDEVTVGHRCILHGAEIGDRCLIGMGAILLAGSRIGEGSIIAAGALVKENYEVPPRSLMVGIPARRVRDVSEQEYASIITSADHYVERIEHYLDR